MSAGIIRLECPRAFLPFHPMKISLSKIRNKTDVV
jgi:hypothetical protein